MSFNRSKSNNSIRRFAMLNLMGCFVMQTAQAAVPTQLSLLQAQKLAQAAMECAQTKKISIAIAIVNTEGNLILFQRDPAAYVGSIDASIAKAKSSNAFRRATSAFTKSLKEGRLELLSLPGVIALEGGIPILLEGQHLGAIGISGGRSLEDEECAVTALEKMR